MKFLFIVQGEGRGHLTQAITLESILRRSGHEVVEVLVGKSESRRLPGFFNRSIQAPIKQFVSPNFLPTHNNKRVNLTRSVLYNLMKLPTYAESIRFIYRRICETKADMVINLFQASSGFPEEIALSEFLLPPDRLGSFRTPGSFIPFDAGRFD